MALVEEAVQLLRRAGVQLDDGLTEQEMARVELRFGFRFSEDHAALLRAVLPIGAKAWPNWREDDEDALRQRIEWPADGIVFDVHNNAFWPRSWGPRPADPMEAETQARAGVAAWPQLVPLYSHRYLPAAPAPSGAPVFSVYQTDVIYYGSDLVDYLKREFHLDPEPRDHMVIRHTLYPWSDLAVGGEDHEL